MTPTKRERRDPGEWRPIEELMYGRDRAERSGLSVFGPPIMRWRRQVARTGRRSAAVGLAVAFVLLLASQCLSWANVATDGPGQSSDVGVGIESAPTVLVLAYYLIWTVVLALAGATVYAPRRARHALFGASLGAIAVQLIAIVPVLQHPKGLVGVEVTSLPEFQSATELVVTRQAGMFCAVAALLVLAFSMVLAVGGDVVPALGADASEDGNEVLEVIEAEPGTDEGEHVEHERGQQNFPSAESVPPSSPAPAGHLEIDGLTVERVEALPDGPISIPPADTDHSAYVRPLGNEQYRR